MFFYEYPCNVNALTDTIGKFVQIVIKRRGEGTGI
jgi:hypothetical protein